MKKISILIILICTFCANIFSQHTNILISDWEYPEEPSIMFDPLRPNIVVAGMNISQFAYSDNGGETWETGKLTSQEHGVWGDPCIIVDTAGHFYFFHLSNPAEGSWIDRIVCQKSTDNGKTWSEGVGIGKNGTKVQDKEWAVVDRKTNTIYITWTQFDEYGSTSTDCKSNIMFSKSTDAGLTWTEAKQINEISGDCLDDDDTVEGAVPTVGTNGEVYVSWAGSQGLMFDRSTDGGETWLENDIKVNDIGGGWVYEIPEINRCNGLPVTLCDTSKTSTRGTIYINWSDQTNGEADTDIWLVKSIDNGNTWSQPKKVNDDNSGKHQFFTWMAIDQITGYVYCVFYDRRNYNDERTDVYMAVSKDGGQSFDNFKISNDSFTPHKSVFFGDYTNIVAHNNRIRPIWARLDGQELSVMTALIDFNNLGIDELDETPIILEQNRPNPFIDKTFIKYKIYKPQHISIKIYDLYGKQITTLLNNEFRTTGKYIEEFKASEYNLSAGVYFIHLVMDKKIQIKKMILAE